MYIQVYEYIYLYVPCTNTYLHMYICMYHVYTCSYSFATACWKAVLVVLEFHEANLRDQLDYDDSSGIYPILSVLPDKFARFLFEFHSCQFESLDLPILTDDRSQFDVHCALEVDKVTQFECL